MVYDGVLDDECEAFRSVLGLLTDAEVAVVGSHAGSFAGPGAIQAVDLTFDQVDTADVVVVPGGLGCERAADDPELRAFLHRMGDRARYVAASSTGTVVLASAGLLHGAPAATHWLATGLLRRYGSEADDRRMVIAGNVITCEGRISAVEAAFALVERIEGSAAVERIRTTLLARGRPLLHEPNLWERLAERLLGRSPIPTGNRSGGAPAVDGAARPDASWRPIREDSDDAPVTPLSVMIELVDNDELVRRMKRRAGNRRR